MKTIAYYDLLETLHLCIKDSLLKGTAPSTGLVIVATNAAAGWPAESLLMTKYGSRLEMAFSIIKEGVFEDDMSDHQQTSHSISPSILVFWTDILD